MLNVMKNIEKPKFKYAGTGRWAAEAGSSRIIRLGAPTDVGDSRRKKEVTPVKLGDPTHTLLEVVLGCWRPTHFHSLSSPKPESRLGSRPLPSWAFPLSSSHATHPRSGTARRSATKLRDVASWPLRSKLPTRLCPAGPRPPAPRSWTQADSQTEEGQGPARVQTSAYGPPLASWPRSSFSVAQNG